MNLFLFLFILVLVVFPVVAAYFLWRFSRGAPLKWQLAARIPSVLLLCFSTTVGLGFVLANSMCGRREFTPTLSNDGEVFAQVIETDCGATDPFHTSVRLWRNRPFKRFFKSDVFNISHDPRLVEVKWSDSRALVIRYPNDSREVKELNCQSEWQGIRIQCVDYEPDYRGYVDSMPPVHRWPYW
jgi:hypothetical protein